MTTPLEPESNRTENVAKWKMTTPGLADQCDAAAAEIHGWTSRAVSVSTIIALKMQRAMARLKLEMAQKQKALAARKAP